jgi:hypothetical protein
MGMQTQSSLHNFSDFQIFYSHHSISVVISSGHSVEVSPSFGFCDSGIWMFICFCFSSVEGFEFPDYLFIENVCFCFALLNKQVVHK